MTPTWLDSPEVAESTTIDPPPVPYKLDDAVKDIVGLSSYDGGPFDAARVRSYVEQMAELARSDPEAMESHWGDPIRVVVYHVFRFEVCYAHLSDFCAGRLREPLTAEAANEFLEVWTAAHPDPAPATD